MSGDDDAVASHWSEFAAAGKQDVMIRRLLGHQAGLAFGTGAPGGSVGFADPEVGLGFGHLMNRMDYHLTDDPREVALRSAVADCLT